MKDYLHTQLSLSLIHILFLNVISRETLCFGRRSDCSSISGDIIADATAKFFCARIRACSTRARKSRLMRTISKNCFISSSRLSLSNLCPRRAVARRTLSLLSSMRVGLTFSLATVSYTHLWKTLPSISWFLLKM